MGTLGCVALVSLARGGCRSSDGVSGAPWCSSGVSVAVVASVGGVVCGGVMAAAGDMAPVDMAVAGAVVPATDVADAGNLAALTGGVAVVDGPDMQRRKRRLRSVTLPDPSTLTWYCRCGRTSTMCPDLFHFPFVCIITAVWAVSGLRLCALLLYTASRGSLWREWSFSLSLAASIQSLWSS